MSVVIAIFAITMFSIAAYLFRSEEASPWLAGFVLVWSALLYLTLLNFTRLTTTVTPSLVKLHWRLGWPAKSLDRSSIVAAEPHRNSWLAGWGIRKVAKGWMWNVWGLDSVNLELDTGRTFRIGTDDVSGLRSALAR